MRRLSIFLVLLMAYPVMADTNSVILVCRSNKYSTIWPSVQTRLARFIGTNSIIEIDRFPKAKAGVPYGAAYLSPLGIAQNFNDGRNRISNADWNAVANLLPPPFGDVYVGTNGAAWMISEGYTNLVIGGVTNGG